MEGPVPVELRPFSSALSSQVPTTASSTVTEDFSHPLFQLSTQLCCAPQTGHGRCPTPGVCVSSGPANRLQSQHVGSGPLCHCGFAPLHRPETAREADTLLGTAGLQFAFICSEQTVSHSLLQAGGGLIPRCAVGVGPGHPRDRS